MSEWISAKDRLPKPYEVVLTAAYFREVSDSLVYIGNVNGIDKWDICGVKNSGEYTVTHWMPLPELPKEEEK